MRHSRIDASFFLVLLMIVVLAGGGLSVYFATRVDPVDLALSGDRIVNTLIVLEKDGKPLSAHVLMYYPETKRAALIDVPGELGQIIRSLGRVDRIDALYEHRRPQAFIKELEGVLGVDIPFFLEYDLDEASRLVDLLGGVDLFITDSITEYDADPKILLPAGAVRLDGAKAAVYATFTLPDEDDSNPVLRRQRFTLALLKRIGEMYPFLSSRGVQPFFFSVVHTNMDDRSFSRLLAELRGVDVDRVAVQRVQGNVREVSGQQLLFPFYDGTLIKDIVKQSLASLALDSEGWTADRVYTIEVLNGTANQGLATRAALLLQGFGYDTVKIGNADRSDYAATEIVNRAGDDKAVRLFADVIRCDAIRNDPRSGGEPSDPVLDGGADFTLILGKDFNGRYVVN